MVFGYDPKIKYGSFLNGTASEKDIKRPHSTGSSTSVKSIAVWCCWVDTTKFDKDPWK